MSVLCQQPKWSGRQLRWPYLNVTPNLPLLPRRYKEYVCRKRTFGCPNPLKIIWCSLGAIWLITEWPVSIRRVVEHGVGQGLFQLAVLVRKLLQSPSFGQVHAAEFALSVVEVADPVFAA